MNAHELWKQAYDKETKSPTVIGLCMLVIAASLIDAVGVLREIKEGQEDMHAIAEASYRRERR